MHQCGSARSYLYYSYPLRTRHVYKIIGLTDLGMELLNLNPNSRHNYDSLQIVHKMTASGDGIPVDHSMIDCYTLRGQPVLGHRYCRCYIDHSCYRPAMQEKIKKLNLR